MSNLDLAERLILGSITKPSERDKQQKIGPSALGGCPYCLGYDMAARLPSPPIPRNQGFGYAAWVGTAGHYWIENHLDLGDVYTQHHEEKLYVGTIAGYGEIWGTSDLYVPELAMNLDWKFPGKWSYEKLTLALKKREIALKRGEDVTAVMLPSTKYRVQQMCYAKGQELLGRPIEEVAIVFFPRHSNDVNDVIFWSEPYQPALVDAAFARAEQIWEDVQAGELDEIPSSDDCYLCTTQGR